jgi:hypothetical protein
VYVGLGLEMCGWNGLMIESEKVVFHLGLNITIAIEYRYLIVSGCANIKTAKGFLLATNKNENNISLGNIKNRGSYDENEKDKYFILSSKSDGTGTHISK